MRVLVIGGTGTVGSALVGALRRRNARVRVLTRHPERGNGGSGVELVAADLADPETLPPAFAGVDSVYLLTPLLPNEAELGRAAVRAAADAGIGRLVFQSVHRVTEAPHVPHFRTKIEILEALRESGLPHTVISPNSFFQNDDWHVETIRRHGIYPAPIGEVGIQPVDVRDIADAAARVLTEDGHDGENYALVGPAAWTGPSTAAAWSRELERPVQYAGNDLEAWAAQARQALPEWLVEDLVIMYAWFQEQGLLATDEEVTRLTALLGRGPRRYEDYVSEAAAG